MIRFLFIGLIIIFQQSSIAESKQLSISKQIPLVQQLCRAFEKDGRSEAAEKILDENPVRDPSCLACKSLFGAFETACKSKKKPKKLKEGEVAKTTPKQRDPHPEVMRLCGAIVQSFSKDEKNLSEYKKSVDKITLLLAGSYPNRAPAEIEYFTTVREYFMQAFPEIQNESSEVEAKPTINVGSLFDE